jgi:hypothetical protein
MGRHGSWVRCLDGNLNFISIFKFKSWHESFQELMESREIVKEENWLATSLKAADLIGGGIK